VYVIWSCMCVNGSGVLWWDILPWVRSRMVINCEIFLQSMVKNPEISHFCCGRPLLFDHGVYNSDGRCVIGVYWVGGRGWPSSIRTRWITCASFVFTKGTPSSALHAEAATSVSIAHVMSRLPFSWIGKPFCGILTRKKWPPAQLCPFSVNL
jgi:hypothetical protein